MKKISYAIGLLFLCLLVGCGSNSSSNLSAFNESNDISEDDLKVEESKDEVLNQLQNNSNGNLEALISNHFPFVDSVTGEDTTANVYGTLLFEVEELADILSEIEQPDEKSDFIDGQLILMYSNDNFIILKESEEIPGATFIEVASEQFVRDNYSPNFLTTYFTIRMLDSVFGNNWVTNRRSYCSSNDCYGGYSTSRSYNNGNLSTNRGMGTFRGGGPSSGK
ncbi:DUF4247 domain-containing protein [Gracilibacillus caseinilyticus]|uniref:DUF4247 domain-containing protein n=1 Tax=Gracilibacillus caseinilyticus TaxID=2932256 RepID=A0ABY4F2Y4_9BACI|nr:DUF4247 domain-containing protein [Gracilibacillus caseinilyticus]UOQ50600.1 DUF4247 domain-containing protein [Gracilibacillus caseinilyticus]